MGASYLAYLSSVRRSIGCIHGVAILGVRVGGDDPGRFCRCLHRFQIDEEGDHENRTADCRRDADPASHRPGHRDHLISSKD